MPDGPLGASVTLLAAAPGTLTYEWNVVQGAHRDLDFFGLNTAPGGSVTIVPEPSTRLLLVVGLLGFAVCKPSR